MGFTEEKEVSVQESMSRLLVEMDQMRKENKMLRKEMNLVIKHVNPMVSDIVQLKKKVGAIDEENGKKMGETETLKEKLETVGEETKTLKEKVGEVEEETKTLKEKVRAVEEETKNLKNVGEVEEETKALKETVGSIKQEDTETLKKNVGAIEEEIRALKEKVVEIKQEEKRVAQKIQDLKVDALTAQYNSFLDRKAKFDHEGDEKLRTFFVGFTVETLITASSSLIKHFASKFHGWIMTLTVAMSLMIFLALGIYLSISSYDFISQAKNLKTEKKGLESDFRKVKERNGDTEAGTLDHEHAAKMAQDALRSPVPGGTVSPFTIAITVDCYSETEHCPRGSRLAQDKADCLKEMPVRVMPFLCAAGVILVVTVGCFIGQLIFVGKVFKLF